MQTFEFVAPSKVYQVPRSSVQGRLDEAGYTFRDNPIGLAKTKTGGLATIWPGHPYPRKTFIYAGITQANNNVKRITLLMMLPFASLRKGFTAFLESYLLNYNRLVDSLYAEHDQIPYLRYESYSEFGKSLWDFIYLFLKRLGVKDGTAWRTGLQITTAIEYDDAYKVRLQDILHIADKEALRKTPRKEMARLISIYLSRESYWQDGDEASTGEKILRMSKLIGYLFYIPRFRKAFNFALENVNFEWFRLDEWDAYWTLNRSGYNCGGKTFEERYPVMVQMMVDYAKKMNPDKEVITEEHDGVIKVITRNYE